MWVWFRNLIAADSRLSQWHCIAIFSGRLPFLAHPEGPSSDSVSLASISVAGNGAVRSDIQRPEVVFVKWAWSLTSIVYISRHLMHWMHILKQFCCPWNCVPINTKFPLYQYIGLACYKRMEQEEPMCIDHNQFETLYHLLSYTLNIVLAFFVANWHSMI